MLSKITSFISDLPIESISEDRKENLQLLIDYISEKKKLQQDIKLNFICTHNSRRSQFAQIWAKVLAVYFDIKIDVCSGGVEVTEFNKNAISNLKLIGFEIENKNSENPHYYVRFSNDHPLIEMFSKIYDDPINCNDHFIAIMTCSDADSNCPIIPGVEQRISLTYRDPKAYDGTDLQERMYGETSKTIAAELYYVFSKLASN